MKTNCYNKVLSFAIGVLFATVMCNAQSIGDFRSAGTGNWNNPGTWQMFTGAWSSTMAVPSGTSGAITVRSGHTVTVTANTTANQLRVATGSTLLIGPAAALTLTEEPGTDLYIEFGGIVQTIGNGNLNANLNVSTEVYGVLRNGSGVQTPVIETSMYLTIRDGGVFEWNRDGGNLPIVHTIFDPGSTMKFVGVISAKPGNLDQAFHHFIWDCPNQTSDMNLTGQLRTIHGDFTVASTGTGSIRMTNGLNQTTTIDGDYYHTGGTLVFTDGGDWKINVAGDVFFTGGTIQLSRDGTGSTPEFNVAGNFTMSNATLVMSMYTGTNSLNGISKLQIEGHLTLTSGTITEDSPTIGKGIIVFRGIGNQSFTVTGSITNTIDITVVKAGGTVILNNNVNMDGSTTLTMTSGNINAGVNTLTLGSSATSTGTLVHSSGTIIGTFKRWISANTGSWMFPVGTPTQFRPVYINFTSAPSSGGTLAVSFIATDPGDAGLPVYDGMAMVEIFNALADGYWPIVSANGFAGGIYNLDLVATAFQPVADYTTLRILKRATSSSNWMLDGFHTAGTGSNESPIVHRTSMSEFGECGIGESNENPLPVELVSFSGTYLNGNIRLRWKTATEINNLGFEVERSADLERWITVGFVEGHGSVNTPQLYAYDDILPNSMEHSGQLFYRLRQLDRDGRSHLSGALTIQLGAIPMAAELHSNYPNPTGSTTSISFTLREAGPVVLSMVDALGHEIMRIIDGQLLEAGRHIMPFSTVGLQSGVYILHLQTPGASSHHTMTVMQ